MDFQEVKRPFWTQSGKRPIKVRKRPINDTKRPIKAMVLVGISVRCLMGCFRAPPPWRKTAPLKRPIKRSMVGSPETGDSFWTPNPHIKCTKYEQKYGPQTAEFALFSSIWGHILSRCLRIFLPCMRGAGVTGVCLRNNSRESGDPREAANRFARIGPSKPADVSIRPSERLELLA